MESDNLQKHIYSTYFSLRVGLGLLALLFPLLLWGIGYVRGISLQASMSDYYFAFAPENTAVREFRMRGFFVGILFAVGSFLYLYKGFSRTENFVLNVAGISAFLVALIPMQTPSYCDNCGTNDYAQWHLRFAYLLFGCVAFVAIFCTERTLQELKDRDTKNRFRVGYDIIAALMVVLPILAYVATEDGWFSRWRTFILEFVGIWTFAAYWFVKTRELRISEAEMDAMKGKMTAETAKTRVAAEAAAVDVAREGEAPAKQLNWHDWTLGARMAVFNFTELVSDKTALNARAGAAKVATGAKMAAKVVASAAGGSKRK